jgi:hypothetical protein
VFMYRPGAAGRPVAHLYSPARHGLTPHGRPFVTPTTPNPPPRGKWLGHCGHEMSHPEVVVVEARRACDFTLAAAVVVPVATIASAVIDAAAQTTDVNLFKLPRQVSSDGCADRVTV